VIEGQIGLETPMRALMIPLLLSIFGISSADPAFAARKKLTLQGEVCEIVLTYDPAKADKARITDTFAMLVMPPWAMTFGVGVFEAKDIGNADPGEITRQCADSIAKVKSLKLLPDKVYEKRRQTILAQLEDSCSYHQTLLAGYTNPSALRAYKPASQSCARFVDALEGKTDLNAMFETVLQESCKDNADTASCLARGRKKSGNTAEMKVDVQGYGWNNCAINFLLINAPQEQQERQKLSEGFLQRFKAEQMECEN
jgi:hypothetical protein